MPENLEVKRLGPNLLGVKDVEMMGRKYDWRLNTDTRQMYYRESAHLGGGFAPIQDNSRYAKEVRQTYRKVGMAMFMFRG